MGTKETIIRLRYEGKELEAGLEAVAQKSDSANEGFSKLQTNLLSTSAAADLAQKAFSLLREGLGNVIELASRGDEVNDVAAAFDRMYGAADALGKEGLANLSAALQGTVSNFEIFKAANHAAMTDMDPARFMQVASAAKVLGENVGIGTTEALAGLARGVEFANSRLLRQYGLLIDSAQAERTFAESIGTTADKLNEAGKKEALREEALRLMAKAVEDAGKAEAGAGEEWEKFTIALSNSRDELAQAIDNCQTLANVFATLTNIVQSATDAVAALFGSMDSKSLAAREGYLSWIAGVGRQLGRLDGTGGFTGMLGSFGQVIQGNASQRQWANTELQRAAAIGDEAQSMFDTQYTLGTFGFAEPLRHNAQWITDQAEAARKAQEEISKAITGWRLLEERADAKTLAARLEDSIKNVDRGAFDSLREKLASSLETALRDELTQKAGAALGHGISTSDIDEQVATQLDEALREFDEAWDKSAADNAKKSAEEWQKQMQASATFFSDFFYNLLTGKAFDFKDVFMRILSGVAGGALAQLTGGFGANFGSAQGLGQALGMAMFGNAVPLATAVGTSSFGSMLGTGAAGGGLALLGSAGGGAGVMLQSGAVVPASMAMLYPESAIMGSAPLASTGFASLGLGASLGVGAAVALGGYSLYNDYRNIRGGNANWLQYGALGLDLMFPGAGLAVNALGGALGVGQGASAEELMRRQWRGALMDQGVITANQNLPLFGGSYASFRNNAYGGAMDALTPRAEKGGFGALGDLLSTVESGHVDEQLSNMFANALSQADSFNAAALTAQGILERMGQSAEEAGNAIIQAYGDGAITLEEFNSMLDTAQSLAVDSLSSITDAATLLGDALDGTPRDALRALEIAFNTARNVGVQDIHALGTTISQVLGVDATAVFEELSAAGIDQFTDMSSLSQEQIQLIFNKLEELRKVLGVTAAAQNEAFNIDEGNSKRALKKWGELIDKIREATDAIEEFNDANEESWGPELPSMTVGGRPVNNIYYETIP